MAMLAAGGLAAGVINTMAGGGSLLTVPLLVMLGLPGTVANGTNRVAVLVQSVVASWRFGAEGVPGLQAALPVTVPLVAGATVGALGVSMLPDEIFERLFGVVMLVLLVPALRAPSARRTAGALSPAMAWVVFFAIGLYGGAVQAGVGIVLVLALSRAGHDLVLSNSIKVVVVALFTVVAVAIFVYQGQVRWAPAAVLSASMAAGAVIGARVSVRGGERVVRPVLVVAVMLLAGRMLRLY